MAAIFRAVAEAGDSWPYRSEDTEGADVFFAKGNATYVAEADGRLVGMYYLRPNEKGRGAHVANCGYMVASDARGLGVGKALCADSLARAKVAGYAAMQFNYVVSTNAAAVALWQKMGFRILCDLPGAFDHAELGKVDAHVMWRDL